MKVEKITYGSLTCLCCRQSHSDKAVYILYPMDILSGWIAEAAARYNVSIAVITGMDWDNDLTPWKAPGVPEGTPDFAGGSAAFLAMLTGTVIPAIERRMNFSITPQRTLVGVSLSGLFALWQWPLSDFFNNIATLSGSFWYHGFVQWIWQQSFAGKTGQCFMLLGKDEPHSPNPVFATVGKCTADIVGYLRRQNIPVVYQTVKGNHYQYPIRRLDTALSALFPSPANDIPHTK